jgi:hypothetical protein
MQQSSVRGVSPHGIQWHFAAHGDDVSPAHDPFRSLQKRCNHVLGQHPAITRNAFLDRLETSDYSLTSFLAAMNQQAIFWRQLVLAREHHALLLSEQHRFQEDRFATLPVAVCFDGHGVPWCPPVPDSGLGDPYALSERLYEWWRSWQYAFPALAASSYGLREATQPTQRLCEFVDRHYNAADDITAIGTMVAVESALSTDCWERLRQCGEKLCLHLGKPFPMPGFLVTSELHARLQARHAMHRLDERSHDGSSLDDDALFVAIRSCLTRMAEFEQAQANMLQHEMH